MKMVYRYLAALLVAAATSFALPAGERTAIPAGTPLFAEPSLFSRVVGSGPLEAEVTRGPFRGFSGQHPLAWYNDYFEVAAPGGGKAYFTPDATLPQRAGVSPLLWQTPPLPELRILFTLAAAVFLAAVAVKFFRELRAGTLVPGGRAEAGYWIAIAVLLRVTLGLLTATRFGNVIPSAADDPGYFRTISDMLHGDWSGPWNFTVGLGFFYLPFILICGAREFYDIAVAFDYFSMLVIAPAALALGFLILRRLGLSVRQAGAAMTIQALWPFFFYHLENWNVKNFSCFFALPPSPDAAYGFARFYAFCINAGFNAMSDTPGMLTLLAVLLLVLSMPLRRRWALAAGALYGFACLIRINYILAAPLLFFAALYRMRRDEVSGKAMEQLLMTLCAAAGFLAVFGIQIYVNCRQFGSPFTFGYILHYTDYAPGDRPADGFTLRTLLKGVHIRFLAEANLALWAPGIAALLLEKSRLRRTVLALWAVPLIWFFFGYSHTFCDARRFVLPTVTALLGAIAALDFWRTSPLRHRVAAGVAVAAAAVLGLPLVSPAGSAPFLLNCTAGPEAWRWFGAASWLLAAASAAVGAWLWRSGSRQGGLFVLLFAALYFFAVPVVLAGILLAILVRALVDGALLICNGAPPKQPDAKAAK